METYQTAFYIRLSKETLSAKEHETAAYQEKILRDYIEDKPEFQWIETYSDMNFSGAVLIRPALIRLCRDIESGKINCVITKDFSRVGRDYIEVGTFMDQIAAAGGRLLVLNDGYDSAHCTSMEEMEAGLKNILNAMSLNMTSEKVREVTKLKRERGDYPSGFGPYGYRRDPVDKNHLLVDDVTAPIVRKIFNLRLKGETLKKIAQILTEQHIPTPSQYRIQTGKCKKGENEARSAWNHNTIQGILTNPYYTGNAVNGRYQYGGLHEKRVAFHAAEKWTIVKNTHVALVSEEDFYRVQETLPGPRRKNNSSVADAGDILPPIIFCAQC